MKRLTPFGAMGKIRGADEYVAFVPSAGSFGEFDRWVSENMDYAAQRGSSWLDRYGEGRAFAFVHSFDGSGNFLAGALAPSRDGAGRAYPLFVAAEVEPDPSVFASLELLPVGLEEAWTAATQVLTTATDDGSISGLRTLLDAAANAVPGHLDAAPEAFVQWANALPLAELEELLFDTTDGDRLPRAVRTVVTALAPHRDQRLLRTKLAFRLPLGRVGGAAVCFWLGLVQRSLGLKWAIPSFFWTHDGTRGSLLVYAGRPTRSTLGQLWMPTDADDLVDLCDPAMSPAPSQCSPDLEANLARRDASIAQVLATV